MFHFYFVWTWCNYNSLHIYHSEHFSCEDWISVHCSNIHHHFYPLVGISPEHRAHQWNIHAVCLEVSVFFGMSSINSIELMCAAVISVWTFWKTSVHTPLLWPTHLWKAWTSGLTFHVQEWLFLVLSLEANFYGPYFLMVLSGRD